jgi:hypothetical protein
VGTVVGVTAGLVASGRTSDVEGMCRDGKCPPPAYDALDEATIWANVSTGGFVVAGVGVVLTAVGLMMGRSAPAASMRGATPGPTVFLYPHGVRGSF